MTIETTELKIWLALRDKANLHPDLPFVAYPSEEFTPPTDANGLPDVYWIFDDMRFDVPRSYVDTEAGNHHMGDFQVHIMMPLRFNYEQHMQAAGGVIDFFPKDTRLEYGGVVVNVTDKPKTIGAAYRDGAYNRLPVLIRWRANG